MTGQPIEREALGTKEAMNEVMNEPSSKYHVKMIVT